MIEKGFIFYPDKRIDLTPSDTGLIFEDIYLRTSDGVKINGWFVPYEGARAGLLWFHGNAGNLSDRVEKLGLLHRKLKINIFAIDYREYGRSEGSVSEEGTYRDALAAYDYLTTRSEVDPSRVILFGQSLGAAVAVDLALHREAAGVILEAPFASIKEMARVAFPWLPIGSLLSTRFDNLSKIARIGAPLLIIQGDRDEVIPYSQGRKVYEAAGEPKAFYTVPGAGHNDIYLVGGEAYFKAMSDFIRALPFRPG